MSEAGLEYLDRILERDRLKKGGSGSPFLDAVANLPYDKHDVTGALSIAEEALAAIGEDDPFRQTFERVLEYKRGDGRYDKHDMNGIIRICSEAKVERSAAAEASRPFGR